jgi:hypothetical protein
MKRFAWITMLLVGVASAAAPTPARTVHVGNGVTRVDLLGDGTPGLIVSGHRENFNAHSFEVVSFYLQIDSVTSVKEWNIVPLMEKEKERLQLTVSGGADCLLHDFRLLTRQGKVPTTLILADRELGDSFANPAPVTFTYFLLRHDTQGMPGFPPYSFELSHASRSKAAYCDVGEAFQKELGLGKR